MTKHWLSGKLFHMNDIGIPLLLHTQTKTSPRTLYHVYSFHLRNTTWLSLMRTHRELRQIQVCVVTRIWKADVEYRTDRKLD